MKAVAHPQHRTIAVIAALALWSGGCGLVDDARELIVERHRASARGRVGGLRALEVHDAAAQLARRIKNRGDGLCSGVEAGPFEAEVTIEAEVVGGGERVIGRFVEVRRVKRDERGGVEVRSTVDFLDPSGRAGVVTREERIIGDRRYVKEQNLPFVEQRSHEGESEGLVRRGLDAVPGLIAAAPRGWRPDPDVEGSFLADGEVDGEVPSCGLGAGEEAWLRRLLQAARLDLAEATQNRGGADGDRIRGVSARLLMGGGEGVAAVRLDVEEKVHYGSHLEAVSRPEEVAEVRRDRPYWDIERVLVERMGLALEPRALK